jgi:RND family efflux transporter MFP subunit
MNANRTATLKIGRRHLGRAFVLGIFALLAACRDQAPEAPAQPPSIEARHFHARMRKGEISLSGSVEGSRTAKLGFLVAGKIATISVQEGQEVRAGQVLASLDPESYSIALEIADAGLAQVQDEYDRLAALHAKGSVAESDFAKVAGGLRQAKAQRRLQARNLDDTRLVSGFSGVLLQRGAEIGEIVPSGAPLFTVANLDPVKVTAAVPERELRRLRIGQKARLRIDAIDTSLVGKVVEVGALADAATRSFSVKLEVANPRHRLRPGMVARITLASQDSSRALFLPLACIQRRSEGDAAVYVVDSARSQVFEQRVSLGTIDGESVEVLSGLHEGALVATQGVAKLHDAARISLGSTR